MTLKVYLLVEQDGTPYSDLPSQPVQVFLSEQDADMECYSLNNAEEDIMILGGYNYPECRYVIDELPVSKMSNEAIESFIAKLECELRERDGKEV